MNDATLTIRDHLTSLADLSVLVSDEMSEDIAALAALVLSTVEAGGKIMFCGNGGSAANAQHLANPISINHETAISSLQ